MDGQFGEVVAVFVDRAKSGKDTNRPELQRMLRAIRNREITLVMVSELSRLSRSIRDFCEIWELMRSSGCEFQSLREQFDTTSAAGEMVLYTIANIAQFERKQTSERILANFSARAERGLFNGGAIPIGYKRHPEKKGYLVIAPEEASIVREAFASFLREGCLSKAGLSLNERGYRMPRRRNGGGAKARMGHFTLENLYNLLTNPMYVGLRRYQLKGEVLTTKAVWEPIIDEKTFQKVAEVLKRNFRRLKSHSARRHPYLLSGILHCGKCGDRLCGKTAHGSHGKFPYYEHSWSTKRQACLNKKIFACNPNRVSAPLLEKHVWLHADALLSEPALAASLIEQAKKEHEAHANVSEMDRLRNKVRGIEEQIDAVAEHLTKIPKGMSPQPIFAQMQRLDVLKEETKKELDELGRTSGCTDVPAALKDFRAYLTALRSIIGLSDSPEIRAKLIKWIVSRVDLLPKSFRIHYFVGKSVIVPVDWEAKPPTAEQKAYEGPEGIAPADSTQGS